MAGSANGGELPGRRQHLGSDIVNVALAEQSGRRTIGQRGVQALEPGLDHRGVLSLGEEHRGLVCQPQATQVLTASNLTCAIGPLPHRAGFFHPPR